MANLRSLLAMTLSVLLKLRHWKKKVKQLEQMLERKTMEAEILRDALEIAQSKKLISRMPLLPPDDIP
ncbi:hypothetical protein SOASR015_18520 [Pectobacterium carotovorum subsp. carotovorum]|nr:hypothetical protein SOASR015_18520 [Pectobacterium carotovorum subsp. carotovorum]GLX56851.1 hypothetical protein Pcaca02_21600 [Pectobacterium carotovorum subsp. carotovorum]